MFSKQTLIQNLNFRESEWRTQFPEPPEIGLQTIRRLRVRNDCQLESTEIQSGMGPVDDRIVSESNTDQIVGPLLKSLSSATTV